MNDYIRMGDGRRIAELEAQLATKEQLLAEARELLLAEWLNVDATDRISWDDRRDKLLQALGGQKDAD